MSEWSDDISPIGASREPAQRSARRSFNETLTVGSSEARPTDAGDREQETIKIGARAGRSFSDNAIRMLANIDKHGTVDDAPPSAETPTAETASPQAAAVPAVAVPPPSGTPAGNAPAAAAAAPSPDPAAEHIARAERLADHNRRLLAELEAARAAPPKREASARDKALDEAERSYLDDPIASIRRLVATAIGSEDPKSKEVDAELSGLYQDLTERELGVSLDETKKASREAARTRRLLERDRRDRRTETEAASKPVEADVEAEKAAKAHPIIATRIAEHKLGERYPLMMALAQDLDGMKPEEMLWRGISYGFKSGELDAKMPEVELIEHVSKKIEAHYQALADKFGKARPTTAPSTATPTQASPATEIKAEAPGSGPRTITNASASVAPATPPAKKPESTAQDQAPPKYRNEKERRAALAQKHFPDSR